MKLILKKSLDLPRSADALIAERGHLWFAFSNREGLQQYSGERAEDMKEKAVFPVHLRADGGITKYGDRIFAATAKERIISAIDPGTGDQQEILDLKKLQGGKNTGGIRSKNSSIADIAWQNGSLWVAVEAGYASCIVEIDLDKREILRDFWAPSPKPKGLDFDNDGERLWVMEGRTNMLVDLAKNGELLGTGKKLPVEEVRHLSIDSENNFWTVDTQRALSYCIGRED